MFKHIFKIIWNEKRINILLVVEYVLIFSILWFVGEYMFREISNHLEPKGVEMNHTYRIFMSRFDPLEGEPKGPSGDERHTLTQTVEQRLLSYPGIEAVSFSKSSVPYADGHHTFPYYNSADSLDETRAAFMMVDNSRVTPGFFEVFNIPLTQSGGEWNATTNGGGAYVSTDHRGYLGERQVADVRRITRDRTNRTYDVVGYTPDVVMNETRRGLQYIFRPLPYRDIFLNEIEISVRVRPEADRNFVEKFMRDMSEPLRVGDYYLSNVVSYKDIRKNYFSMEGITARMNMHYAIVGFLLLNIFLGILGSFWFRTQTRRPEIGLRVALGSSKGKVRRWMIFESMALLVVASVVAAVGCFFLQKTPLPQLVGASTRPRVSYTYIQDDTVAQGYRIVKESVGIIGQDVINFAIAFGLLALITVIAVWYPAKQASDTQPAQTLHED